MLDYLKNILPRLKQHGQALDRKELFSDQPWVIVDEQLNKQQIIFKRDGRLLMSTNGQGFEGKWEYLPEVNGLWIDRGFDKLLLNQGFYLDGVMILKKDGIKDEPVLFANPNKVPDLDVQKYLEPIFKKKTQTAKLEQSVLTYPLELGKELDVYDCWSINYLNNNRCEIEGQIPLDGTYNMLGDNVRFVIENGLLKRIFYTNIYKTDLGDLYIDQKRNDYFTYNDSVYQENNPYPTGTFLFPKDSIIKFLQLDNGKVVKIKYKRRLTQDLGVVFIILAIIVLALLAVVASMQ